MNRFIAFLVACGFAALSSAADKPNIVLILADDLGYSDLGCYGSEIATPNLDRLASQGVRFTQFYNNGRCCPSRASIMTGRYPHQVGVGAMIDGYAKWIRDAADRLSYEDHLESDEPTIAEMLRPHGYRTLMSGKWHLGDRKTEWPAARGFDRSFVLIPGAMNYFGGESTGPRSPMALDDQAWTPPHDGFFSTDAFADHAIGFVEESVKKASPFFLYLAFNAPHWPLHAPPQDIEKYKDTYNDGWRAIQNRRLAAMIQLGIVSQEQLAQVQMDRGKTKPWDQLLADEQREWALRMQIFAAQVTRMDQQIGRLLEQLNKLGVADNTLVLFLSDNGGAPEDPHRGQPGAALGSRDSFWGYARPWATVSNTPWRNHKVTAYEGGISTPLIAHWPAKIPQAKNGSLVREPAHLMDLVPTLLNVAGAESDDPRFEGENILPMVLGNPGNPEREFCWEHEGNRAIRKGKWKLTMLSTDTAWQLYDMTNDRTESRDLAQANPQVVQELADFYEAWAKRCGVVPWEVIEKSRPRENSKR